MKQGKEKIKELEPYCPCRVCSQTTLQAFVGFFIHGNCKVCHGCLKTASDGFSVSEAYIKEAQQRKDNGWTNSISERTNYCSRRRISQVA